MKRKKLFEEALFVRVEAGTKARLEALSGETPVSGKWMRGFVAEALSLREARVNDSLV